MIKLKFISNHLILSNVCSSPKRNYSFILLFLFHLLFSSFIYAYELNLRNFSSYGSYAAVSTGHPDATKAAIKILKRGGNAIDAAVAAAFVLSVVDPSNSGLGGDGHALIMLPSGEIIGIDASSPPPQNQKNSLNNYFKAGLPTEVALLCYIHKHWGRKDLTEVLAPAIKLAQKGFKISNYYHRLIEQNINDIKDELFYNTYTNGSRILQPGETAKNLPLANLLKSIALYGSEAFYKGEISKIIHSELHSIKSFYSLQEIESYKPKVYKPIYMDIENWKLVGLGIPASSMVVMALVKKLVTENLPDFSTQDDFIKTLYYMAITLRLKKQYLASFYNKPWKFFEFFDQKFNENFIRFYNNRIPLRFLFKPDYLEMVEHQKNPNISSTSERTSNSAFLKKLHNYHLYKTKYLHINDHANQSTPFLEAEKENTTHLVVCDKNGYAITLTLTLGKHFGSKKYSSLGFFYNDQGNNFSSKNALYPANYPYNYGPITAKSPIILFKNQKPVLFIGGAGANQIILNLALILSSYILNKGDLPTLVHAPRAGFDSSGNVILEWHSNIHLLDKQKKWIEKIASYTILSSGHDKFGLISAVEYQNNETFHAVADFRRTGSAQSLNNDPRQTTKWLLDLIIYNYKGIREISTAEIIPSPRQISTGWKIIGRNMLIDSSQPTPRSKFKLPSMQNIKFSAASLRQSVEINPIANHSAPYPYENPSYWQSEIPLTQREYEFYKSIPSNFKSEEEFVKWLMLKIAFDFSYKRIKGIMSSDELIKKGYGDCSGKARLFEKMCRTKKIPTRLVGGVILREGLLQSTHIWNEVFIKNKWITVCPTNIIFGELPPNWVIMRYGDVTTLESPGKFFIKAKKINKKYQDVEIDDE